MEIKVGELYWDRSIKITVKVTGINTEYVEATKIGIRKDPALDGWSYRFSSTVEKEELDNLILLVEDVEEGEEDQGV